MPRQADVAKKLKCAKVTSLLKLHSTAPHSKSLLPLYVVVLRKTARDVKREVPVVPVWILVEAYYSLTCLPNSTRKVE
jgi:hypothetical protein